MRNWMYPSLAVGIIIILAVALYSWQQTPDTTNPPAGNSISRQGAQAFGSFSSASPVATETAADQLTGRNEASPSLGTSKLTIAPDILPVPSIRYEYIYTGELALPNLPVIRRRVETAQASNTINSLNLFRPSTFQSLESQYLTVTESTDDGYTISFDYQNGTVSIYRDSSRAITALEGDGTADKSTEVPAANLASDTEVITSANTWLSQHGISREGLADPVVRPDPNYNFERLAADALLLPVDALVIYPWLIDGQTVYDDSGFPYGLTVAVSRTNQAVSSVYNLAVRTFESSAYALANDAAEILAIAKRGGLYSLQPEAGEGVTTVVIELGAPISGYVTSHYQLDMTNREYLIPALIFPITQVPEGHTLYQTAIVVPLVQELLDQANATGSGSSGQTEPRDAVVPPELDVE